MENKLKKIFDYQKFERNPKLAQVIVESEGCFEAIGDDELAYVAGGVSTPSESNVEAAISNAYKKNKNSIYDGAYLIYGSYRINIVSFSLGTVNYSVIKPSTNQIVLTGSFKLKTTSGGVL